MEHFTPLSSALGGVLIGIASAVMLLASGRIAGISGIAGGIRRRERGDTSWRVMFVLGLALAGAMVAAIDPSRFAFEIQRSHGALLAAGLLVGLGTRIGNGCTSGHGVCGLSRLSKRSIAATVTFMATAAATAFVINELLGGA